MEIRVIEIGNGYLIYSDKLDKPEFRHQAIAAKVCIEELVKVWVAEQIQEANK